MTIDPAKPGQAKHEFRMPVLLDIHASDSEDEMIAIGAGQYRRKSQGDSEWLEDDEDTVPANGQTKRRRAD